MASQKQLHMVFFPLMAQGHMIPLFDIARLFAARGVQTTLITTHGNAVAFPKHKKVEIKILKFPSEEVGLPEGVENLSQLTETDHLTRFTEALKLIAEGPLAEMLQEQRASCLVADMFLPWTADVAGRLNIPWVAFHGGGYFALAVAEVLMRERPQWTVETEEEEFVVPELPGGEVRLNRRKLPPVWRVKEEDSEFAKTVREVSETAVERSFGVISNTFHELESDYQEYYGNAVGTRCWSVGPVSMCFRDMEGKATRGKQANVDVDVNECLAWLDSKPQDSVIYVCFGSVVRVSFSQLTEIAMALESSNHHFIWVVRRQDIESTWKPPTVHCGLCRINTISSVLMRQMLSLIF